MFSLLKSILKRSKSKKFSRRRNRKLRKKKPLSISKKKTTKKKAQKKPKKKIKSVSKKVVKKPTKKVKPKKKLALKKKKLKPKKKPALKKKKLKPKKKPAPAKKKKSKELLIGVVSHYFSNISVAAIELKETLVLGDKILIKGANDNLTQVVRSMQINRQEVDIAPKGSEIGMKVKSKVHQNSKVFKV